MSNLKCETSNGEQLVKTAARTKKSREAKLSKWILNVGYGLIENGGRKRCSDKTDFLVDFNPNNDSPNPDKWRVIAGGFVNTRE